MRGDSMTRVAILCSFNLDLVARPFVKAAHALGIELEVYLGPYAQWEQELLDPSSNLYAYAPALTIVFVDAEDALPSLSTGAQPTTIGDAEARGRAAWQSTERAVERTGGAVWIHTMIGPPKNGLGMLEGNAGYSHTAAIDAFNRELRAFAARQPRVAVLDYAALVADRGYGRWYDARLWHVGRMRLANTSLSLLAQAYANQLAAASTPRRKCLVLDLDNTLWGGVIGEDGIAGIQLGHSGVGLAYRELQLAILALYRRGVILAVASKNNPTDALAAIETHPDMVLRPEYFAVLEIHWQDKHESIKRVAERLDIGLDSVVFWDDNPMERGMVRSMLPDVLVPEVPAEPSDHVRFLRELTCFDTLSLTSEDQRRGQMYRELAARDTFLEQSSSGTTLEDYFASLEMVVQIDNASDVSILRIAQLTQRTNQVQPSLRGAIATRTCARARTTLRGACTRCRFAIDSATSASSARRCCIPATTRGSSTRS